MRNLLLESTELEHHGIKMFQFFVLNESTSLTTATPRSASRVRCRLAEASL
jgi:hypothetical protein